MNRRLFQALACIVIVAVAVAADEKKAKNEKDALQGTWVCLSAVRNGEKTPADQVKGMHFTIKGDKMIIKPPAAAASADKMREATITINSSKSPKEMDVDFGENMKGKGIYKLEGDTLTIAHGEFGDARPKDFTSEKGSNISVITLRRGKGTK